jgi:autotransporter-associated beta strand protein
LAVIVSGSAPLNYFWFKDGSYLSANATANSALLNISSAATNDSGGYYVLVTNSIGSITSSVVSILITNVPPTPPSIAQPPASQSAGLGGSASFTVTANGSQPLAYQWFAAGAPLTDGGVVSGSQTATLNLSNLSDGYFTSYYVVITNSYGAITSSVVNLTQVFAAPVVVKANNATSLNQGSSWTGGVAPAATSIAQWDTTSVSTSTHSADVGGSASWYGINIVGWSASVGCEVTDVSASNVITLGAGGITSSNLTHSYTFAPGLALAAVQSWIWGASAASPKLTINGAVSNNGHPLTIGGVGGGGVIIGGIISGSGSLTCAGTTSLTLTGANTFTGSTVVNSGTLVLSGAGSIGASPLITVSGGAGVDVSGLASGLTLGASQTLSLNPTANLKGNIKVLGNLTINYTNGIPVAQINGVLTLTNSTQVNISVTGSPLNAGTYLLIATNGVGASVTGNLPQNVNVTGLSPGLGASLQLTPAGLSMVVAATFISFYPAQDGGPGFFSGENLQIYTNSALRLSCWSSPNPAAPVAAWTLEGGLVEFPDAANPGFSRYGITVDPSASPEYYIFAPTNVGQYLANEPLVWLTTDDYVNFNFTGTNMPISTNGVFQFPSPPFIAQQPLSQNVLAGSVASFVVAAGGAAPLTYQWRQGGLAMGGATASNLVINPVSIGHAGNYDVIITNNYGAVTSSAAMLTVTPPPALTLTTGAGGNFQLNAGSLTGLVYVVQTTTNLAGPGWTPVLTNTTGPNGVINFTNHFGNAPGSFYRLWFP